MKDGIRTTHPAQGRVTGDRVELAFGYWPGRGAPLIALHGLTASYVSFTGVAERLEGRRPLFALDLRGRGDSGKPAGPYGMAQHAADVAAAMQAMGLGASIVVGHSMGGFVATALAAAYPELVSGLLLIDGGYAPAISAPNSQTGLDAALALRITQLRQTYPSREVYRQFWRAQPHFPPEDWSPWVEAFLDYEIGGEPPELRPKAAEDAVKADLMEGLQSEQIAARLQAIRVPVLMLRAPAGFVPGAPPLFPDAMIEQMRKLVPAMDDKVIAGTTHYTLVMGKTGAARIADLAIDFATRCESSPATGR
ncbi:MAG: alpha/beta fold hydrolase [Terracidiphilus sp.]